MTRIQYQQLSKAPGGPFALFFPRRLPLGGDHAISHHGADEPGRGNMDFIRQPVQVIEAKRGHERRLPPGAAGVKSCKAGTSSGARPFTRSIAASSRSHSAFRKR